jgi:hypothetical protein
MKEAIKKSGSTLPLILRLFQLHRITGKRSFCQFFSGKIHHLRGNERLGQIPVNADHRQHFVVFHYRLPVCWRIVEMCMGMGCVCVV